MKKFNLKEALAGAKVVTRDGDEVTDLHKFNVEDKHPVVGVLLGQIQSWTTDGEYWGSDVKHNRDLFMHVEPQRIWVNVHRFPDERLFVGNGYSTREEALAARDTYFNYVKTIEITE